MEKKETRIRAAQFLGNGNVICVDGDGKKIATVSEPSVKAFIETKLKKGEVDDSTRIYANMKIRTVGQLKKELKIKPKNWLARLIGW